MKKWRLVTGLSALLFMCALGFGARSVRAETINPPDVKYGAPAPQPAPYHDNAHFQPNCGPGNKYLQFGRCANESYFFRNAFRGFGGGDWIWAYAHDGTAAPDITSANGSGMGDLSGFVNVTRSKLIGTNANYGLNYLKGLGCGASDHTEYGKYHTGFDWCEAYAAEMLGAAQYVNEMLGMSADDPAFFNLGEFRKYCKDGALYPFVFDARQNGIMVSRCRFTEWWRLINYYASQPTGSPNGWIDWNAVPDYSDAADGVIGNNESVIRTDTVIFREGGLFGLAIPGSLDPGFYLNNSIAFAPYSFIQIHNPDGSLFSINKICGNLTGPLGELAVSKNFRLTPVVNPPDLRDAADNPSVENPTKALVKFTVNVTNPPVGFDGEDEQKISVDRSFFVIRNGAPPGVTVPIRANINEDVVFDSTTRDFDDGLVLDLTSLPGGPLRAGDQVCRSVTIIPNQPSDISPLYATKPGQGRAQPSGIVQEHGPATPDPNTFCSRVRDIPYMSFFNGDVFAGGSFVGGPSSRQSAISAKVRTDNGGTASQLAAFGLGPITAFTSASLRGAAPTAPDGLKFANTGPNGNFAAPHSIPDYFSRRTGAAFAGGDVAGLGTSGTTTLHTMTAGSLFGTVGLGKRLIVYVDGDLSISGDITYATNGPGNWNSINEIPSIYVIVRGNISISPSVHRLDGVYIAQPLDASKVQGSGDDASNKGRIYTCDYAVSNPDFYSNCRQQLRVNGAFVAQQVKFQRTYKSLRDANSGTEYSSPNGAEVFYYTPELYIAGPALPATSTSSAGAYDAISNLPPVL